MSSQAPLVPVVFTFPVDADVANNTYRYLDIPTLPIGTYFMQTEGQLTPSGGFVASTVLCDVVDGVRDAGATTVLTSLLSTENLPETGGILRICNGALVTTTRPGMFLEMSTRCYGAYDGTNVRTTSNPADGWGIYLTITRIA